ncbi:leucine-rich repeat protein [Lacrimispora sp. BS-2]|uniref:Leucine-rich repeat protein n=1 Tax=Lacrimispora sp. BS-2 TaxID=3151850 RepID=A0AAU7PUG2_9FIRM
MKRKHVRGKGVWRAAASIMAAVVLTTAIPLNLPVYGEELVKEQESQEPDEGVTDTGDESNEGELVEEKETQESEETVADSENDSTEESKETDEKDHSEPEDDKPEESRAEENQPEEGQTDKGQPEESQTEENQTEKEKADENQQNENETKPENESPVTDDALTGNVDGEQNKPLDQAVSTKMVRVAVSSDDFVINGKGVITEYNGNDMVVDIPSEINDVIVIGIGDGVFEYSDIERVSIPDTIKTIGDDAFSCSFSLESVSFYGNVPSIGNNAFYQCGEGTDGLTFHCPSNLESEYFEALAEWLYDENGNNALEGDLDLYEGDTPSVPQPEDYLDAVEDSSSGGVIIKGLKSGSKETSITIPETLNGKNVTQIKAGAFKNNTKIKTVTIEAGITSIGDGTFNGCSSLETITFPDTLTSIGNEAFYNCKKLKDVTFPDTLSGIGSKAFYNCQNLTGVTFPGSLKAIGSNAFYQCLALERADLSQTEIMVIAQNTFESCQVLSEVVLPEGLETIEQYAFFKCNAITEITLPQSLKRIGQGAFQYAHLTKVEIPAGVGLIGDKEFAAEAFWCDGLKEINVSEDNPSYADVDGVLYTKDKKTLLYYPNGREDTIYKILEGAEEISGYAFKVPAGQRPDNWDSTKGDNLNTIVFPATLKKVGNGAFAQRTLDSMTITPNIEWGTYVLDNCKVKTIEIAEGVTEIPDNFFYGATGFQELTLPASLKRIGNRAFDRFPLESIELPAGLEEIGVEAFECSKLTGIKIPKTVKTIGDRAFYLNKNLKDVVFEEGSALKNTGAFTFNSCSELETITLPYGVEVIDNGCFSSCDSLEYVGIPSTVTTLGDFAFSGSGIRTMELTDSIRYMGTGVFRNSFLEYIKLPASLETMGTCTFEWCRDLEKVIFPDNMKLKNLPSDTFFYCTNLAGLTLPASIARTEPCSLSYCESLKKVEYKNKNLQRSVFDCFAINLNSYFGYGEWDEGTNYGLYIPADTTISTKNGFTVNTDITTITTPEADKTEDLYNEVMSYTNESDGTKTRSASAATANCGCAGGGGIFKYTATISPKFNYVVTQGQDSGGKDDNQNPSNPKDNENGTNPGDTPSGNMPSKNTSSEKSSSEDIISRTGANASLPVNVTGGPSTTRSDGKSPAAGSWAMDGKGWKFNYTADRTSALGWEYVTWNGVSGWYYFNKEGYMLIGWIEDNGRKYYLDRPGAAVQGQMAEGWKLLDGKWYYFNAVSDGVRGALLTDTVTPDGYRVGADGSWNGL